MIRRLLRVLCLVAAIVPIAVWSAEPAGAALPCAVGGNMWIGYTGVASAYQTIGTSAWIQTRTINLCTGPEPQEPDKALKLYTRLENGNYTHDGYSEAGYLTWEGYYAGTAVWNTGLCMYHYGEFSAAAAAGRTPNIYWGGGCVPGDGYGHHYSNVWQPDCNCVKEWVDSVLLGQTNFDPRFQWTTPLSNWWRGIGNPASDVPGTGGLQTMIDGIQIQLWDQTWINAPYNYMSAHNLNQNRWQLFPWSGDTGFGIYTVY